MIMYYCYSIYFRSIALFGCNYRVLLWDPVMLLFISQYRKGIPLAFFMPNVFLDFENTKIKFYFLNWYICIYSVYFLHKLGSSTSRLTPIPTLWRQYTAIISISWEDWSLCGKMFPVAKHFSVTFKHFYFCEVCPRRRERHQYMSERCIENNVKSESIRAEQSSQSHQNSFQSAH